MKKEKSCGAVVYTAENGKIGYLLVRSRKGVWGFPKGHAESGESEEETALREIREETGLAVQLGAGFRTAESYPLPHKADTVKEVVYFIGSYAGQKPVYQEKELTAAGVYPYSEAMRLLTGESRRRILKEADTFLKQRTAE